MNILALRKVEAEGGSGKDKGPVEKGKYYACLEGSSMTIKRIQPENKPLIFGKATKGWDESKFQIIGTLE